MSKSVSNIDWANQLESVIRQFVKENDHAGRNQTVRENIFLSG
jgi:hypothetical protein